MALAGFTETTFTHDDATRGADEEGHPTRAALTRVIGFFRERLGQRGYDRRDLLSVRPIGYARTVGCRACIARVRGHQSEV